MKFLIPLLLICCPALAQHRVVVDGDSLSALCCPTYPAWPTLLTNFNQVIDFAISGGAVVDFPGNPHVITNTYDSTDGMASPASVGTNAFFVLQGSHNAIYSNRVSVDDVFEANVILLDKAKSQGYIAVGCTIAPSKLIADSGMETNRLKFNSQMRGASNTWQILFDWDTILPHDTTDTNWYVDGTHPGTNAVVALSSAFQSLVADYVIAQMGIQDCGGKIIVSWSGYEELQVSSSLFGPYSNTGVFVGPYTNSHPSGEGYYKLTELP